MAETPDSVIEVEHFTAAYQGTVVIDDVSFVVRRGEVFGILGGSGSGKSTLLKHLIGLYRPAAGRIRIQGRDIVAAEGAERRDLMRQFGVMYQSGALFGSLSLLENVSLPLEEFSALPPDAVDLVARMKLKLVGLEKYADHAPSELSGGMQKRAALARAMALDPGILFLDEPSAGLDPITSAELDALILRLNRSLGITFVIVTHELASVFAVTGRVIMLDKERKKIVADGDPRELRDGSPDPWVRQFFNRQAEEDGAEP